MKRISILIAFVLISNLSSSVVCADEIASDPSAQLIAATAKKSVDNREIILKEYLNSHHSPLAPFAKVIIAKADLYGLPDWKLVPAITGVESTFGKKIPSNSYNAYGWANGNYYFSNWEQSIDIVTKTLKEKYFNRGYDTVEKIARIYAPPSKTWNYKVRFFMDKIENYTPLSPYSSLTI